MGRFMIGGILDGHHLVLSVRTIEPVALSRRHISLGHNYVTVTVARARLYTKVQYSTAVYTVLGLQYCTTSSVLVHIYI